MWRARRCWRAIVRSHDAATQDHVNEQMATGSHVQFSRWTHKMKIMIEIAPGELADRLSILEIKLSKITDEACGRLIRWAYAREEGWCH